MITHRDAAASPDERGPTDEVRRILVGYDGRPGSRDALALASLLAEATNASLVLAVVLPGLVPRPGSHAYEETLASESDSLFARATDGLRRLRAHMPLEHRVIGGESPAQGLRDLAVSEGAELIVIGSTHRGPVGRLLLGTTADGLIARGSCAFALAPRGYADYPAPDLRLVGLAYDGSAEAKRAAMVARTLALRADAPLRAFGVREPLVSRIAPAAVLPLDAEGAPLERELDELINGLPPGIGGQKVILDGDPAEALLDQGRYAADLIVFGSHGFGRFLRLVAGSVTSKVVRAAPWPVIVVPLHGRIPFAQPESAPERELSKG